ncbi:hypothetical protein BBH88_18560 (plasmid) [Planococcus antarcticus DSM 14505]|uniref:Uncharacterized protein n=1 Tax=Planococcus antarcticus DSM 14505 TaxID=1185653 RepID=A0ABN4RKQ9_9BACL|nr:hypothetical protein [Planococcus antarcticus]ANU12307.1 hypothetical protein BBH88_18560 [Planococcus antarcticus DSM 14505]
MKSMNVNQVPFSIQKLLVVTVAFLMVFSFAFSSVGQAQAIENDNERITNALEDTLAYENDAYIFDRERAMTMD